jgi:hypothetical protein
MPESVSEEVPELVLEGAPLTGGKDKEESEI